MLIWTHHRRQTDQKNKRVTLYLWGDDNIATYTNADRAIATKYIIVRELKTDKTTKTTLNLPLV